MGEQKHILVIEDDTAVREALAAAFADAGLRVELATDGRNGLEKLRRGARPSVVVLDMRMPRVGGQDFLRELRADPTLEEIPVITMTAGAPPPGRDVVPPHERPFDLHDLLDIVRSLTEPMPA